MTSLAKRIATALLWCLGVGGTLGCERISAIEPSKIPDGTGAGGQDGSTDGTGSSPADAYAHNLAAGTYYLLVEASPSAQGAADTTGQFAYRLAITLR